jgi:diguanylate cyclase (GGDEF)-like protein
MDSDLKFRIANKAFREMWNIPDAVFATKPTLRDIINYNRYNNIYNISEKDFEEYLTEREKEVKQGTSKLKEFHRKDGKIYHYQCVGLPDGGRMLTYFDITNLKQTQNRLSEALEAMQQLAKQDPLTGLFNLRMLEERFLDTLIISKRKNWKIAVLFIDLDGFKIVNDTYGHNIGDLLLKSVAQKLKNLVREIDTVGRIGGYEFIILLTDISDISGVSKVARKIIDQLSLPLEIEKNTLRISASIGISIYPTDGETLQELLARADKAMYRVKIQGKNGYIIFNQGVEVQQSSSIISRLSTESAGEQET